MTAIANDVLRPNASGRNANLQADFLVPHLTRIVRRALRHPNDRSPMAKAVRAAAAQFDPGTTLDPAHADEFQVGQVVRRLVALLTRTFSGRASHGAHPQKVCA